MAADSSTATTEEDAGEEADSHYPPDSEELAASTTQNPGAQTESSSSQTDLAEPPSEADVYSAKPYTETAPRSEADPQTTGTEANEDNSKLHTETEACSADSGTVAKADSEIHTCAEADVARPTQAPWPRQTPSSTTPPERRGHRYGCGR
jgi:hypothetical protein